MVLVRRLALSIGEPSRLRLTTGNSQKTATFTQKPSHETGPGPKVPWIGARQPMDGTLVRLWIAVLAPMDGQTCAYGIEKPVFTRWLFPLFPLLRILYMRAGKVKNGKINFAKTPLAKLAKIGKIESIFDYRNL